MTIIIFLTQFVCRVITLTILCTHILKNDQTGVRIVFSSRYGSSTEVEYCSLYYSKIIQFSWESLHSQ